MVGSWQLAAYPETTNLYSRVLPENQHDGHSGGSLFYVGVVISRQCNFSLRKDARQPKAMRDYEIAWLLKTINFYESLKNRNGVVADNRVQNDAIKKFISRITLLPTTWTMSR